MIDYNKLTTKDIQLMQSIYELAREEYFWQKSYDWNRLDEIYQYHPQGISYFEFPHQHILKDNGMQQIGTTVINCIRECRLKND